MLPQNQTGKYIKMEKGFMVEYKKDIVHSFPKSVDGYANKYGQRTINVGKDGKTYQWLKLNGSYRGKTGTFEYIKDNKGVINHRYFKISK